jgi:hypothetical protein
VYAPLVAAIPFTFVGWLTMDIFRKGIIPRTGKTRDLAMHFLRIITVFFVMWCPALLCIYGVSPWLSPTVDLFLSTLFHLQAGFSAAISLLKPDITKAFKDFITCQKIPHETTDEDFPKNLQ